MIKKIILPLSFDASCLTREIEEKALMRFQSGIAIGDVEIFHSSGRRALLDTLEHEIDFESGDIHVLTKITTDRDTLKESDWTNPDELTLSVYVSNEHVKSTYDHWHLKSAFMLIGDAILHGEVDGWTYSENTAKEIAYSLGQIISATSKEKDKLWVTVLEFLNDTSDRSKKLFGLSQSQLLLLKQ
ncbi:hypothetical protein [Vibrio owensii]|uniref:hypothetical protein n=1 Tax=Vibrio owensii TaxID=696485 RepID=UPI0018F25581|nr:hypothetical protein [Vibrio owensii]